MEVFMDQFVSEKEMKLAIYRENIPNFEQTITTMNSSIENIRTTLCEISNARKTIAESCEETCFNCSPEHLNKLLGIAMKQVVEEVSVQGPSHIQENAISIEKKAQDDTEIEKTKENEVRFVAQVSEQEFNTIPKYQLGRLTRDNLNEIVQKMDEFLMKKSHIFGKKNKQLTRIDRELLDNWKELEMKAKGRLPTTLFFVETDIRPLLQERLRPSFSKAIPCLRHIRRVREERCGPLTFYFS